MGQSLDLICPERHRKRHWHGYHQTMRSGETRYGTRSCLRVPALSKDGRALSIAFTVALLKQDGAVTAIVAIVRDETARWTEDREMRRRLAELGAGACTLQPGASPAALEPTRPD